MLLVPFVDTQHLSLEFLVKTFALQLILRDLSVSRVFVVQIVEPTVFNFNHVSQTMEGLDGTTVKNWVMSKRGIF